MTATFANRGRSLEAVVIASQSDSRGPVLRLDKFPTSSKRIAGGKIIQLKSPVDFIGEVFGSGRAVHLDCKQCDSPNRFPIGNVDHFPAHQREWLIRHGTAGAIAGLVVEATHENQGKFYWMDWRAMHWNTASITWAEFALDRGNLRCLGDNLHTIQFRRLFEPAGVPGEGR